MKLRHRLFWLFLLAGIVPLAISSLLLIRQNRELLETQEKSYLTRSAGFLSVELNNYLAGAREQLRHLGETVLAAPPAAGLESKLRQPWLGEFLGGYLTRQPDLLALRLLSAQGVGPQFASMELAPPVVEVLDEAFAAARAEQGPVYRLVEEPASGRPLAVLALPVGGGEAGAPPLVAEAVLTVRPMQTLFQQEARGDVAVFLVDRGGEILWSRGAQSAVGRAIEESRLVRDFVRYPLNLTAEYTVGLGADEQRMLARISPVAETGWGVIVHKPLATAFGAVREMVINTALSTALLVAFALWVAVTVARRISSPIQRLARTSHEIADGNFRKRVDASGLGPEIGELATDFNRMVDKVERQIEGLRRAAQENQEIFIGSMRAFVAAIDAKDPYTRGHSERVAAHARTIAKFLGRSEDFQQRVWIGALLHDVGKLGIDDRILKKGGVLSADEYDQMKLHPQIGVEIMSRIEQLREMLPIIHWHHEAWNGNGYPDGLKGEQIPLIARIVCVADTFDAITTNRPYQRAYPRDFAVETIRKLTGTRFDAKVVSAFLQAFEADEIRVLRSATLHMPEAASA